ncbi:MAG: HIT family protein [Candidatus Thorarchaeota archaeon]
MSRLWTNHEKWKQLCKKENCPVCLNLPQPENEVDIIKLESGYLCASSDPPLKGTCYLLTYEHYIELYEMHEEEAFVFMKDIMMVAKALKEITGAEKINYEIHGNTVPHLHIILYPRYLIGDNFCDGPIDPKLVTTPVYKENEFVEFIEKMRIALAKSD